MLTSALRSKVDSLWDKFWSGGIANPLTAIEQISYLLFMRRLDAFDEKRRGDAEFLKQEFHSTFAGKYETRAGKRRPREELRWSRWKHLPPRRCWSTCGTTYFLPSRRSRTAAPCSAATCRTRCSSFRRRRCWSKRWGSSTRSTPSSSGNGSNRVSRSRTFRAISTSICFRRSHPRVRTASSGRRGTSSR